MKLYPYAVPADLNTQYAVNAIAGSWNTNTLTWNNQPNYYLAGVATVNPPVTTVLPLQFDVTSIVRNWGNGTWANWGFILRNTNLTFPNATAFRATGIESLEYWFGWARRPQIYLVLESDLPDPTDTTGVFRPSNGLIYLKSSNETGYADADLVFGSPGDLPVTGDWNGDGVDTIGIYRDGVFYLRNSNTTGYADITFAYGAGGDLPVAGDWDGDGDDTVGIYRNGQFMLRNSNTTGTPDMTFALGVAGDEPVAGNWNNDGVDSTGVFRPTNGLIYLKNENTTGYADAQFALRVSGDLPICGKWGSVP